MIISLLDAVIGSLPTYNNQNYEIVRYVIAGVILIFMVSLVYRMFESIFYGIFH